METIDVNLIPGEAYPVCHASQFDVGRVIRCRLLDGYEMYDILGTETFTLKVKKPDTTVVTMELTAVAGRSYVEFSTTEQMCACPGKNICEIEIENGSVVIGTLNFYMDVEEDPLNNGVTSQSAIHDLETQIEEIVHGIVGGGLHATEVNFTYSTYTVIS